MWHEADFVAITKSRFIVECEIKISRGDFFKDFKKEAKHLKMINKVCCANYFYFAAPEGLIKIDEVPEYAGLIEISLVNNKSRAIVIKNAPRIHNEKITDQMLIKLLRSVMYKYFNYKIN